MESGALEGRSDFFTPSQPVPYSLSKRRIGRLMWRKRAACATPVS
jgi:hypothetical protein